MFSLPPLPPWDGLHPLVIHFPIAFVMLTPVLMVLALLWPRHTRALLVTSALVMVLAAAGALLATSTGSAAEELAEKIPGAKAILDEHEELGEVARNLTIGLAGALVLGTLIFCKWGERLPRAAFLAAGFIFLIANGAAALVVANAAHQGGRLVHEVGVRARLSAAPGSAATPTAAPREQSKAEDKDD